ncbi:MAG: DUF3341 domain-containing protein [Gammaproteobacteria bacterium]|nr:DUF3341 domain-containing protein [Gammaproteobacteria bacterium]
MPSSALGLFHDPDSALQAAGELMSAGFPTPEIISPVPIHGIEKVLGEKKSVIRRFTFFGGLFGGLGGFALAAGTAVLYLHPTGGRPIIALPPFLIITYEMTILFGVLMTVLGFLISARLPAIRERLYAPEAAVDKFAVAVPCDDGEKFRRAEAILRSAGAEEVRDAGGSDT